ncbi:hypothetical protein [Flavobacterium restrictum]|uniref:Lipopolysaccharide biosynthesis protein n=1 Tax=Flavobacterium restrictum TaxID=2594428 RepID=A0A553E8R1_9FLAO|nr:hypothetical protein [Flavobacterium restrictum]TRX41365.1 hypothetical protein FNW21_04515 [Flavobacterium restrictum]
MSKTKTIAILATHSFGYIDFLVEKLQASNAVDLTYINIDAIPFSYKNSFSRLANSFLKLFLFAGLKEQNKTKVIQELLGETVWDQILVIRPDKIQSKTLLFLREHALKMSCFLFDGIENYKEQKKTIPYFDTIYSYDKKDVAKYNFTFLTNYIFDDTIDCNEIRNKVFNISSYDSRFPFLEKLACYFSENKILFQFIVKTDKFCEHKNIEVTNTYLTIKEVKNIISASLVLVDLQFKNQCGLSFRVFEALGYSKKLITNNQDIVNYDFYNANNIFVISEENYEIPKAFFETPYIPIKPEILEKYTLKNWILKVFEIDVAQ